ncbi:hypothetical protein CLOM_g5063 [Closterium sp. NIES-68]|nr:hypothetical protein CLOM_g5063 [Closterium sp. NIES-68]GJP64517.1 hypothetical protein CLOP_g21493 [Closterium sp. NIES-67]
MLQTEEFERVGDARDMEMDEQHEGADAGYAEHRLEYYDTDESLAASDDEDSIMDDDDFGFTWRQPGGSRGGTRPFQDNSDDDSDLLEGPEDVSARQVRRGRDVQGIPWERLHLSREKYRAMRLQQYKNYKNLDVSLDAVDKEVQQVATGSGFYEFAYNTRAVKSTIVHFQLRNLVWATSAHDVYSLHHHVINHFSPLTRKSSQVLDLASPLVARPHTHVHAATGAAGSAAGRVGQGSRVQLEAAGRAIYTGPSPSAASAAASPAGAATHTAPGSGRSSSSSSSSTSEGRGADAGGRAQAQQQQEGIWEAVDRVQVSTMCVRHGLLVAGGFHGEMVCKRLGTGSEAGTGSESEAGVAFTGRISRDESAITNAVEIFRANSGALSVLTSNNDCVVRDFDVATFSILSRHAFPWPVNHTAVSPHSTLVSVVGDDPEALLLDLTSGKVVGRMRGHVDYSFATAWHPGGNLFATGNQDTTCRVWDRRRLDSSLFTLKGRLGAIRSLRFTSDGRFMAMAEPADFVHIFDTSSGFTHAQEIDIFGEIAGVSFSPDTEALFVGVADRTYSSLLEYTRAHSHSYLDACT